MSFGITLCCNISAIGGGVSYPEEAKGPAQGRPFRQIKALSGTATGEMDFPRGICQVDTLKDTVSGIKLKMCCSLCLMPCLTDKYSVTAKTWRAAYVRNKQLGPVHDSHKSLNFL